MTILLRQKPLSQVVRQIVQRDNGAWFDPEDFSTMFQDAAGTTPVTALEQPVGLWLDKSQGLELGPELITNGDNEAGVATATLDVLTNFTSKIQSSEKAQSGNYSAKLTSNTTSGLHYWRLFNIPAGVSLRVTGWVYMPTASTNNQPIKLVDFSDGSFIQVIASSFDNWVYFSVIRAAKSTPWVLSIGNNESSNWNGGSIYIDNLSVREIKGNHATQSITASRPTLSARYNLLTNTDNFANAVWLKVNSGVGSTPSVTPNYGIAPNGSQTACRVIFNLNAGNLIGDFSRLTQIISSIPANTTVCSSIYVKTNDGSTKAIMLSIRGEALSVISVTPEWGRISTSGFRADTGYYPRFELRGTFGTSDSADILIWHPQLNIGTTPLPYQRVDTTTDYDSVGWPRYLSFDGIDDFMNLPYMSLYAGGSASMVSARDAVSQAVDTYILSERSTTDADTKYFPSRQLANGWNMGSYIVRDDGVVTLDTVGSVFSGAKLSAIRSVVDSGSNIKLLKDGEKVTDDNYTRAGVLTPTNTTMGASVSTTTSNYANMKLYGLIITKSALSDTDRRRCEQFLASRLSTLGVTLS